MRKSSLFISAALTTFVLVLLVGVVSAYKSMPDSTGATTQQDPTAVATTDTSVPTAIASITPEQAAALASQVIGRTDVYSVETSVLNGASAYLVTFSSGDLVYVSPQGMVLSVVNAPVVVYSAPAAPIKNKNRRPATGGGGGGGGGGEPPEPEGEGH